jgi:hypothetical protein
MRASEARSSSMTRRREPLHRLSRSAGDAHPEARPTSLPTPGSSNLRGDVNVAPIAVRRPGFAVVCWDPDPLSPRGQRALYVTGALQEHGSVARLGGNGQRKGTWSDGRGRRSAIRPHLGQFLANHVLLDTSEPRVIREMNRWRPDCDAAVLIGFPFAPLAYAADRLARSDVPYVVDLGDPWTLTTRGSGSPGARSRRARLAELRMWSGASGGIFTTSGQADAVGAVFPGMPLLVRPNGFEDVDARDVPETERRPNELRLVHYGNFYGPRLDPVPFFESLARSGQWRRISLRQYGSDWTGRLEQVGAYAELEVCQPLPWSEVVAEATQFDVALAIGNRNPHQLPSKAVQYLTLPIPRLALIDSQADALAKYVGTMPGWLTARADDDDLAARLRAFCDRRWTRQELEAPRSESWTAVAEQIARFILKVTTPPTGWRI